MVIKYPEYLDFEIEKTMFEGSNVTYRVCQTLRCWKFSCWFVKFNFTVLPSRLWYFFLGLLNIHLPTWTWPAAMILLLIGWDGLSKSSIGLKWMGYISRGRTKSLYYKSLMFLIWRGTIYLWIFKIHVIW